MGRTIARADRQSQHRRASWSEAIALVCGAFALAVGAADVAASRTPSPAPPADNVAQGDQRTIFQKLSDLWPGRVTLASLTPGGGLFRSGPDLAALGYDSVTAVYDISARAVYLPGG